jgi:hypothetical protein
LERRTPDLTAAAAFLAGLDAKTEEVVRAFEEAKTAFGKAVAARSAAEARFALSVTRSQREALEGEIAEFDRRIAEVDRLVAARTAAADRLAEIRIDEPALEVMSRQESTAREARAAVAAAATRLRFFPSHSQSVKKDGTELQAGEAVDVAEPARFALEGFGAVEVEPGGTVLAENREQLKAAQAALSGALIAAGVADVAEAVTQLAARKEAEAKIIGVNQLIAVHAPEGIGALQSSRRAKSDEQTSVDVKLRRAAVPPDLADPETERRALDDAKVSETGARATLGETHQQHSTELVGARANFENAERNSTEAQEALETARAEMEDAYLVEGLRKAKDGLATANDTKGGTEEALGLADPKGVEDRRQQALENLRGIETRWRELDKRNSALEGGLSALDKGRIREQLEEASAQEARATSRRDRVQAEADACRLLVETLASAESDAKRAFLGPVLQRIQPFLDLLFPGMGLTLEEETLEIKEIARDGRTEPYGTLSIGTREQLSILVRLAFAVYLREKGYPAAVILDDALVYADPGRFERMQLALRKAAETVQILILACRPEDWRPLGVPIRRLADATTAAFEPA